MHNYWIYDILPEHKEFLRISQPEQKCIPEYYLKQLSKKKDLRAKLPTNNAFLPY